MFFRDRDLHKKIDALYDILSVIQDKMAFHLKETQGIGEFLKGFDVCKEPQNNNKNKPKKK